MAYIVTPPRPPRPPNGFGLREPFFQATPEEEKFVDDLIIFTVCRSIWIERMLKRSAFIVAGTGLLVKAQMWGIVQ